MVLAVTNFSLICAFFALSHRNPVCLIQIVACTSTKSCHVSQKAMPSDCFNVNAATSRREECTSCRFDSHQEVSSVAFALPDDGGIDISTKLHGRFGSFRTRIAVESLRKIPELQFAALFHGLG